MFFLCVQNTARQPDEDKRKWHDTLTAVVQPRIDKVKYINANQRVTFIHMTKETIVPLKKSHLDFLLGLINDGWKTNATLRSKRTSTDKNPLLFVTLTRADYELMIVKTWMENFYNLLVRRKSHNWFVNTFSWILETKGMSDICL